MSTALQLISELRALGARIRAEGDQLLISPRSALHPDLEKRLRAAKQELLKLLRAGPARARLAELELLGAMREQPNAWKLYSRALGLELWLARDAATAEAVWAETHSPVLLVDEWTRLSSHGLELVRAVLNVRAEFGPRGVRLCGRSVRRAGAS